LFSYPNVISCSLLVELWVAVPEVLEVFQHWDSSQATLEMLLVVEQRTGMATALKEGRMEIELCECVCMRQHQTNPQQAVPGRWPCPLGEMAADP